MSSTRRLAAIMFSDIAGYTAMMQRDETDGLRRLRRYREVLESRVDAHGGEIIQHYGDGSLSIFSSAVEAVSCAREIQGSLREEPRVPLRIGLHVGDVAMEGEHLYGDGVNLASRVEALAIPGGILLTERVMFDIRNHPEFHLVSLGEFLFKNVKEPMEVFALSDTGLPVPSRREVRRRLQATTAVNERPALRRQRWLWPLLTLLLLVVTAVILWPEGGAYSERKASVSSSKSIAVLPFDDLSASGDQTYFGDGVAEEILNALAQVEELKVVGRTSSFAFRDQSVDLREIGRRLGVNTVLEGSVRRAGDQVVITAQLIDATNGYHLWSEEYDRRMDSIFVIQREIAQSVVGKLKDILLVEGHSAIELNPSTASREAYDLYLKGKYLLSQRADGAQQARDFFQRAVGLDSSFAQAYAGLGHAYLWLAWGSYLPSHEAFPEARRHALRALELQPELAYAHAIMGSIRMWYDWDWSGALEDLERAVSISPSEAGAYLDLGWWHTVAGHFDRGIRSAEKAVELDPLNLEYHIDLADFHRLARHYGAALEMSQAAQQLYPDNSETHWIEGMIHYNQENYRKAERAFRRAGELSEGQTWARVHLAMALAKSGKEAEARALLSELRSRPRQTVAAPVEFAMAYLALGEKATALNLLEQAYRIRANWLISIKVDPVWEPLREEPRFQALVKQMGFPE